MIARAALLSALAGLAGGLALAGCLSVPDGPTPMCDSTSDCNHAAGEVCEEGVCYGNPPPGPFAAVVSPPSTRHDLAPHELATVAIQPDGELGDLALDPPVLFSGKIVEFCPPPMTGCDSTSLGATVTVARVSQFPGGPGFKTVVNVAAADAFSIPLPRTTAADAPYTITIVPDGGHQLGTVRSPAEQVPPRRLYMPIGETMAAAALELGGADLPVISGTLTDSLGQGLTGYRVVALGRWDAGEPATEVSTIDFVDSDGHYAVTLSDDLIGSVELVARPPDSVVAVTVHVAGLDASRSIQRNVTEPATLGIALALPVAIDGLDLTGTVAQVAGATVSVTGTLTVGQASFTMTDDKVTDKAGAAQLHILNGASIVDSYRISIIPSANSTLGAIFDQPIVLPPPPRPLSRRLTGRVALRGTIVDAAGKPLNKVAVTARPALRFLWTLDSGPQAFVGSIPAATTVTPDTGEFLLWVDASVTRVPGAYDLLIEPPSTARAPTYVKTTELAGASDAMAIGTIGLPDAAFVHGRVIGPDGEPVENAEIKLYLGQVELDLCSQLVHAPASCPIPASLQARDTADDDGIVRLALPRS
jgi:hypothetical protein